MQPKDLIIEEVWDVKKIIIGLVSVTTVATGGYLAKDYVFQPSQQQRPVVQSHRPSQEVEGAKTSADQDDDSNSPKLPSFTQAAASVQQKIDTIKNQVTNLNAVEVASSSPQVQKILNDLKNLENYPKDQAKDACYKICSSF